jgi:hypothetical protein
MLSIERGPEAGFFAVTCVVGRAYWEATIWIFSVKLSDVFGLINRIRIGTLIYPVASGF